MCCAHLYTLSVHNVNQYVICLYTFCCVCIFSSLFFFLTIVLGPWSLVSFFFKYVLGNVFDEKLWIYWSIFCNQICLWCASTCFGEFLITLRCVACVFFVQYYIQPSMDRWQTALLLFVFIQNTYSGELIFYYKTFIVSSIVLIILCVAAAAAV